MALDASCVGGILGAHDGGVSLGAFISIFLSDTAGRNDLVLTIDYDLN